MVICLNLHLLIYGRISAEWMYSYHLEYSQQNKQPTTVFSGGGGGGIPPEERPIYIKAWWCIFGLTCLKRGLHVGLAWTAGNIILYVLQLFHQTDVLQYRDTLMRLTRTTSIQNGSIHRPYFHFFVVFEFRSEFAVIDQRSLKIQNLWICKASCWIPPILYSQEAKYIEQG